MANEFMSEARDALRAAMDGSRQLTEMLRRAPRNAKETYRLVKGGMDLLKNKFGEAGTRKDDVAVSRSELTKEEYEKVIYENRFKLDRKDYAFTVTDKEGHVYSHVNDTETFLKVQEDLKNTEDKKLYEEELKENCNKAKRDIIRNRYTVDEAIENNSALARILSDMKEKGINDYNYSEYVSKLNLTDQEILLNSGYTKLVEAENAFRENSMNYHALQRTALLRNEIRLENKSENKDFLAKKDAILKFNEYCEDSLKYLGGISFPKSKEWINKELETINKNFENSMDKYNEAKEKYEKIKSYSDNHPKASEKAKWQKEMTNRANLSKELEHKKMALEQLSTVPKDTINIEDATELINHLTSSPVYKSLHDADSNGYYPSKFYQELKNMDEPGRGNYSVDNLKNIISETYKHETSKSFRKTENEKYLANKMAWQEFYEKHNIGTPQERKDATASSSNDIIYIGKEIDIETGEETDLKAAYSSKVEGERPFITSVVTRQQNVDVIRVSVDNIRNETIRDKGTISNYNNIEKEKGFLPTPSNLAKLKIEEMIKKESLGNYKEIYEKMSEGGAWVSIGTDGTNKDIIMDCLAKTMAEKGYEINEHDLFVGDLRGVVDGGQQSDYTIIMPAEVFKDMDDYVLKEMKIAEINGKSDINGNERPYKMEEIIVSCKPTEEEKAEIAKRNGTEHKLIEKVENPENITIETGETRPGTEISFVKSFIEKYQDDKKNGVEISEFKVKVNVAPRIKDEAGQEYCRNSFYTKNITTTDRMTDYIVDTINSESYLPEEKRENIDRYINREKKISIGTKRQPTANGQERQMATLNLHTESGKFDERDYIAYIRDENGYIIKNEDGTPVKALFKNGQLELLKSGPATDRDLLYDDFKDRELRIYLRERIGENGKVKVLEEEYIEAYVDNDVITHSDNETIRFISREEADRQDLDAYIDSEFFENEVHEEKQEEDKNNIGEKVTISLNNEQKEGTIVFVNPEHVKTKMEEEREH